MSAKIITIAQQKGGAGKTTLVAQLAVCLAAEGRSVAVVDIDPQRSSSAWMDQRTAALGDDNTIHLSAVGGWKLDTELSRLSRSYDFVLVDSPPHAETEAKAAIRAADLVVIPMQPSPMDLWAIEPTLKLADAHKAEKLIVLNRVPPRGKLVDTMRDKLAEMALPVSDTALGNRQAYAASMMDGLGVVESHKRTAAATEIRNLAAEINTRFQ